MHNLKRIDRESRKECVLNLLRSKVNLRVEKAIIQIEYVWSTSCIESKHETFETREVIFKFLALHVDLRGKTRYIANILLINVRACELPYRGVKIELMVSIPLKAWTLDQNSLIYRYVLWVQREGHNVEHKPNYFRLISKSDIQGESECHKNWVAVISILLVIQLTLKFEGWNQV